MKIGKWEFNIKKSDLTTEDSAPSPFGIRNAWDSSEIAKVLDPGRLSTLVSGAINGDTHDYLTLAEEMEERDLHYRSVLSTRKHSILALDPIIEIDSDDPKQQEIAEDVRRTILKNPAFNTLMKDALDGLGKGFSVSEIIWKTSASKWIPVNYKWRDPRWFRYDLETGRRLQLRVDSGYEELKPFKYIIHEPQLKSGLPIRNGIALAVAYYYLIKNYDVSGWAAFCETFGYPIRIGKYDGRKGSKKDKEVLKAAVRNLGKDVGAVIPKSMEIEIINGIQTTGNIDLYERLANWTDKQVSKAVLGQTMSSDAEGGQYKGDLHNEVRQEIRESDAAQLEATINRDLIRPYIDLNYGKQEHYPYFILPVPRPENIPVLVEAIEKLVPLGFKVGTEELYKKIGLSRPGGKDEILAAQTQPVSMNTELNSLQNQNTNTALDDIVNSAESDWIEIAEPVKNELEKIITSCNSYDELLNKIPDLVGKLSTENSANKIAVSTFLARALGDINFEEK